MRRIIKLKEVAHLSLKSSKNEYRCESIKAAIEALINRNLRFDNATGKIRERSEIIEQQCNSSDFKPHVCEADVMEWEFSRYIRNSASRIERGFEP